MILEGVKLAAIGMSIVFAFLILLVLLVVLSTYLFRAITEKEANTEALGGQAKARGTTQLNDSRLVAVVSAAVAAHRAGMQRLIKS